MRHFSAACTTTLVFFNRASSLSIFSDKSGKVILVDQFRRFDRARIAGPQQIGIHQQGRGGFGIRRDAEIYQVVNTFFIFFPGENLKKLPPVLQLLFS